MRYPLASALLALAPGLVPSAIELLGDRFQVDGQPTAFVCHGFSCLLPVTDPGAFRAQLGGAQPPFGP